MLVFSAIPFTAVKALANSPLGARLRRRLEARKAAAAAEAAALRAAARDARDNRCHPISASLTGGTKAFHLSVADSALPEQLQLLVRRGSAAVAWPRALRLP